MGMSFDSHPLLLHREPFTPHPFASIREGVFPQPIAENIYESWVRKFAANTHMQAEQIRYQSDDQQVTGFMFSPKDRPDSGRPAIIFNRGGRRSYGMINVLTINNLIAPLVERGYLVFASQYRGTDGSTGEDEFGGAEVQDILSLAELAQAFPDWDGHNLFQFGWSRGGMMSLLALKHGLQVKATALVAPLVDLTLSTDESKQREAWLQRVLPDYESQGFAMLEARSAPYWLDKLQQNPLLLMHGDADQDVSILHSRQLAQRLKARNHPHKLVEYEGGNHYLNRQRDQLMQEIAEWFAQ